VLKRYWFDNPSAVTHLHIECGILFCVLYAELHNISTGSCSSSVCRWLQELPHCSRPCQVQVCKWLSCIVEYIFILRWHFISVFWNSLYALCTICKQIFNKPFCYVEKKRWSLNYVKIEGLRDRTEYIDIFLFPPITHSCSVSNVLFTGGRGVSDFSVLKYY